MDRPVTDWAQQRCYFDATTDALHWPRDRRQVVMMGDSITDNWAKAEYGGSFLKDNALIGRGISGQVTGQMLVRFPSEVVALEPRIVHIMGGTNDIAGERDPYIFKLTASHILGMVDMAKAHKMTVMIGSVPPAGSFPWIPWAENPVPAIKELNAWLQTLCQKHKMIYCDYYNALSDSEGNLRPEFALPNDTVHPGPRGYAVMGPVLLDGLRRARFRALGRWFPG